MKFKNDIEALARINIGTFSVAGGGDLNLRDDTTASTVNKSIYVSAQNSGRASIFLDTTAQAGVSHIGFGPTQYAAQNTSGSIEYTNSSSTLVIKTNYQPAITIDSDRNVGIGTQTPTLAKVEVNGILKLTATTATGANHIVMGQGSSRYINYRLPSAPYGGIMYIILCANAGSNDVNGTIKMDRSSGYKFAASMDVLISAGSSSGPVGGLRTFSTAGNGKPNCELVKVTYNPGTGAAEHIAIKVTNPDFYTETTGTYFTGRSSVIALMKPVTATSISNETPFGANTVFNFDGDVSFNSYGAGTLATDASGNITSNSINHVGIWFQFPGIANTVSTRSDGWFSGKTVKYTQFQANFDNLTLESGSTYKLIIERFRKGQGDAYNRTTARKSGYKRQLTGGDYSSFPYSARPVEIAITSLSQNFNFRPDLYYTSAPGTAGTGAPFPRPSGFSSSSARKSSRQYFAFRISKTTSGVTEVSDVLAKLQLIGSTSFGNCITWKPYQ